MGLFVISNVLIVQILYFSIRRDFGSLDVDSQQYLLDIVEGGVTHKFVFII